MKLSHYTPLKILTAHKKPPNLRDLLVKADITKPLLPDKPLDPHLIQITCTRCNFSRITRTTDLEKTKRQFNCLTHIIHHQHFSGNKFKPCQTPTCKACPDMPRTQKKINHSPPIYSDTQLKCNSHNVIYALICPHCNLTYIGQTCNDIRTRLWGHRQKIRDPKTILHRHLNHSAPEDFKVHLLQQIPHAHLLTLFESLYIWLCQTTHPQGLNQRFSEYPILTSVKRFGKHFAHHPLAQAIIQPVANP
jgi:hypothetical protein